MIVIRKEQWNALAEASELLMRQRTLSWAIQHYPDYYGQTPSNQLEVLITRCIERARSYGLVSEPDIRHFIELVADFGFDFENRSEHQYAGAVLNDEARSPATKVLLLADYRTFRSG